MKHQFVSVIIPVWDHSETLAACLQALENQTYPKDSYEVIVIDNDSPHDLKFCKNYSQTRLAFEKKPGSYAARNKGISLAKGDILAFTDADCIPVKNWIEKGAKELQSKPNQGFIGGNIQQFAKDKPTIVELYELHPLLDQKYFVEERAAAMTGNLFTFKHVMKNIGPFDEKMKSSGDIEWCSRVVKAGYLYDYSLDARVDHAARSTLGQVYRRERRISGGLYLLQKQGFHFKKISPNMKLNHFRKILSKTERKYVLPMLLLILFIRSIRSLETLLLILGGKPQR
jgi:glycosyltransferase involved in cell wall biosynthesis